MKIKIFLLLIFFIININFLFAEEPDEYSELFKEENNIQKKESKTAKNSYQGNMFKNNPHQQTRGLSVFKPNYFLITRGDLFDNVSYYTDRKDYEVQFQLSFKQQLFQIKDLGLYGVYSQKSFFQIFDFDNSSPFRETNYNPQVFFKWSLIDYFSIDFGYDHESNGQEIPESRSWNRFFLYPHLKTEYFAINWRFWYRIPENSKKDPLAAEGDDNPDILDYYGYHELNLIFEIWDIQLSTSGRFNFKTKKGAIWADLSIPVLINTTCLYFQYWNGYGESLIDYNIKLQRFGVGIMFSR